MNGSAIIRRMEPGIRALSHRSDLALAALLVMTVFMLVLPLPTLLVDALIAFSLSSAVVLLAVGIYVGSAVSFSAFPSVLLLATLFRLALSITTTRLILLQGDAGQVVQTFGDFVVAGNLIVGVVIFLIVTAVQFVVITKGAERIAEVSARFSLDAMPGKQMSIDGDMRSGLIGLSQATRRRQRLEEESQLYGAMDGAMKFVKGDAIAGLIIISVNSIGGVSIAMLERGLSFGDALTRYTVLTIGDGLVAQIPALLIAMAAGVMVSRVSGEGRSSLGEDIGAQVFAQPKALVLSGALVAAFALVPGFPAPVFLALGAALGGVGLALGKARFRRNEHGTRFDAASSPGTLEPMRNGSGTCEDDEALPVQPVEILIDESLDGVLAPAALGLALRRTKRKFYARTGIPFPGLRLRYVAGADLEGQPSGAPNRDTGRYRIAVHDVPVARGEIVRGHVLVHATTRELERLRIDSGVDSGTGPANSQYPTSRWVGKRHAGRLRSEGFAALEPEQALGFHLMVVLERHPADFVGLQETRGLLDRMERDYPELVKESQSLVPVQRVSEVLRRLAAEGVPIRNMRGILETLVEWAPRETDAERLCDYVRLALRRQISHHYSRGEGVINAITLAREVEQTLRDSIQTTASTTRLVLAPELGRSLLEDLDRVYANARKLVRSPVLLTPVELRRPLRGLIARDYRELPVLARQELVPEITVRSIEQLELMAGATA